jgi:hypothetical protein
MPVMQRVLFFLVVLILLGCGISNVTVGVDNLFDPQDPDYQPPNTEIVSGPTVGDVLDTTRVVFQWRHADPNYWPDTARSGNIPARIQYAYRLSGSNWSPWLSGEDLLTNPYSFWTYDSTTGIHTLVLDNLEDGQHSFEIRSKYPTNIEENSWPTQQFTIDHIPGTAFVLSPTHAYVDSGAAFITYARVVDVTDFMGLHLSLSYNTDDLALLDYSVASDSTDFLLQAGGQSIEFIENDSTAGLFRMDLTVAGGNVTGVTGTGNVVRFIFMHVGTGNETEINLQPESQVRDVYNQNVTQGLLGSKISIW